MAAVNLTTHPEIHKTVSHVSVEPNENNETFATGQKDFLSGSEAAEKAPGNCTDVREILSMVKNHQNLLSEAILQVQGTQEGERERQFLISKKMGISTSLRQFAKRLRDSQLLLENTLDDYQEYKYLWKKKIKKTKEETNFSSLNDSFPNEDISKGRERERERAETTEGEKERVEGGGERGEGIIARGGEGGGERGGKEGERGVRGGGEREGERCIVDVKELISYAHKISYTTFAPPEFAQGLGLLGALPPLPQDEQMRASALYQFTDEDLGVPKPVDTTEETLIPETLISKPLVPETLIPGALTQPKESLPPLTQEVGVGGVGGGQGASTTPLGGVKKEGLNGVPVPPRPPPGWKPGDPITLLPELGALPPPPPGWKPGDPIPLPPMPTPSVSVRPTLPVPRGVPPPPPTTVQVRHVELDLNPELEDSESDYSGSSDED